VTQNVGLTQRTAAACRGSGEQPLMRTHAVAFVQKIDARSCPPTNIHETFHTWARRGLPPLGPVDTCALGGAEASL